MDADDASPTLGILSRFLSNNDVLEPLDAAPIRKLLDDATTRINLLRAEIKELEKHRHNLRAVISPVRRLRPEILARIFQDVVGDDNLSKHGRHQVIRLGLAHHGQRDTAYEKIKTWLGRSGTLPKDVVYDGESCQCEYLEIDDCRTSNWALAHLLTDGPRLNHFTLNVTNSWCAREVFERIEDHVEGQTEGSADGERDVAWDALNSLDITFDGEGKEWRGESEDMTLFDMLPKLTHFNMWLAPAGWELGGLAIDLHVPPDLLNNLTSFTVACDWEGSHILAMLVDCVNVETLEISFQTKTLHHDPNDPLQKHLITRLVLPKVHILRLTYAEDLEILRYIQTPALRDLQLSFCSSFISEEDTPDAFTNLSPLEGFIEASNCYENLHSLHVDDMPVKGEDLATIILILPSVKRLVLENMFCFKNSELWDSLYDNTRDFKNGMRTYVMNLRRCMAPDLEELELLNVPIDFNFNAVGHFLKEKGSQCSVVVSYASSESKKKKKALSKILGLPVTIVPGSGLY